MSETPKQNPVTFRNRQQIHGDMYDTFDSLIYPSNFYKIKFLKNSDATEIALGDNEFITVHTERM